MADIFEDLRAAGIEAPSSGDGRLALAETLGFSFAHLDRVMNGQNPYTGKLKATIQMLIQGNVPETVEQGEADLKHGPILTPTNEQSSWSEPADLPPASDYAVIDATDGTAVLVEILARFNNHTAARKICQKLNGEKG